MENLTFKIYNSLFPINQKTNKFKEIECEFFCGFDVLCYGSDILRCVE